MLWLRKVSLMKIQIRILDNRLYYTRKIELHRKGKKSRTVRITPILIGPLAAKSLVLITVRRVHYGDMGKAPTTIYETVSKSIICQKPKRSTVSYLNSVQSDDTC